MTYHSNKPLIKYMRVRVAFKISKRIHERDMWIITVFIFTKKAKDKELIVREILEVVELTHSKLTLDEHKRQHKVKMSSA